MKIKRILSTFLITLLSLLTLAQPLLASNWQPVPSYSEMTANVSAQNGQLTMTDAKVEGLTSLTFYGNTISTETEVAVAGLPAEYQEVDYIESHGTEYIDTGIIISNLSLEIEFAYSNKNNEKALFGVLNSVGGGYHITYYNTKWYYSCGTTEFNGNPLVDITEKQLLRFNFNNEIRFNGIFFSNIEQPSVSFPNTLILFGRRVNANVDVATLSSSKIYKVILYSNSSLVLNLIPCYRKSDNVVGLYDLVTQTFFTNQGTGAFTYGNPVSQTGTTTQITIFNNDSVWTTTNSQSVNLGASSINGLNGIGNVRDEFDAQSGTLTRRIGTRAYTSGDENDPSVITDMTNTLYVLSSPVVTTITAQGITISSGTNIITQTSGNIANTDVTAVYTQVLTNAQSGVYVGNAGSGALFEDLLNDVPQDATTATLTLVSNITTLNTSFAVPNNVTINLNGNTITGVPQQYKDFVEWINRDTQATATSFVSGNTYDAVYAPQSRNITYMIPSMTNISVPTMDDYALTLSGNNYTATDTYPIGEGKLLPIPKMTGYTFDGWYTNANYTGQRYTSVPNNATTNLTYYAKWRTAPSLIEIKDVHVYRNLMNVNDRLITFMYNIDWRNNTPSSSLNDWFTFNLLDQDGTTILATCQPYPFWDYGYGHGVGSFYFGNDDLIDWGGEYQIRIDGDSSKWTDTSAIVTIYNLQAINYSDTAGNEANKDLLTGQIINYARTMEIVSIDENFPMLVYVDANGNTILTTQGQVYFRNDIPNIAKMTNGIFSIGSEPVIIDPSDTPTPSSQTLIEKWETQYEGTWVQDSLEGLGDLLGMNWRTATSILLLVAWVVLASISQIRWGTTDAGMWCGGVLMGVGVTMGIMNWAIVGTALILLTFYCVYIVFWRQG